MPIFTSLLLIFVALAILPLALRSNSLARMRRQRARDEYRMAAGALICETAARNAFGAELDHSVESIAKLDSIITEGWSGVVANSHEKSQERLFFTFSSYLGDVLVRHAGAKWQNENAGWSLGFSKLDLIADPFNLIEQRLHDPEHVHLQDDTTLLLQELERLRHPVQNSLKTRSDEQAGGTE